MIFNLEGVDGSGKGTQFNLLKQKFDEEGIQFKTFDFPRYGHESAKRVELFLQGKLNDVSPYQIAEFYAEDRLAARPEIESAIGKGVLILFNRFVPSNMVYQAARYDEIEEQNHIINLIEELEYGTNKLPRPNNNIITAIDFNLSQSNVDKKGDRGYISGRDVNENDSKLQQNVSIIYDRLCSERSDFIRVECMGEAGQMRSREAIHKDIWAIVEKALNE